MKHLSYTEFKELTGKTSVTDWVKYNWLSASRSKSKRCIVYNCVHYESLPNSKVTQLVKIVRSFNWWYEWAYTESLARVTSAIKRNLDVNGELVLVEGEKYIMAEIPDKYADIQDPRDIMYKMIWDKYAELGVPATEPDGVFAPTTLEEFQASTPYGLLDGLFYAEVVDPNDYRNLYKLISTK